MKTENVALASPAASFQVSFRGQVPRYLGNSLAKVMYFLKYADLFLKRTEK